MVLVVDDLLATGGTLEATVKLIRRAGGEEDAAFVINLFDLSGEARLNALGIDCYTGQLPRPLRPSRRQP